MYAWSVKTRFAAVPALKVYGHTTRSCTPMRNPPPLAEAFLSRLLAMVEELHTQLRNDLGEKNVG